MIISHSRRFIFFAVPKTGTHSVREALRETMVEGDLEQVGLFVNKRFPFPEFNDVKHGHFTVAQIRPVLGEAVFQSYFKFAFVRNPFDRFVSYCSFMSRNTGHFQSAPREFMKHVAFELRPIHHVLFRPQSDFLVDEDGKLQMDFVGRTETMQASYDAACQRIGNPSSTLGKINSSERRPYRDYYDAALRDGVAALYQRDLDMFGYVY